VQEEQTFRLIEESYVPERTGVTLAEGKPQGGISECELGVNDHSKT
jgi:hypothetical protein